MATTGTTGYAPSLGEIGLNAFSRISIRGPEITQGHMLTLRQEANLMQASWSNRGPNLWTVDLQTVAITQGQIQVTVPTDTVTILDAYINDGTSDRPILPISRTDYASYPDKTTQGAPTAFWFDRLIAPVLNLYPAPDQAYTLNYYRYRQIQDAATAAAVNLEIPYLWLDAAAAGLAHRLARHFKPEIEAQRKADADEAYAIAAEQNTENAPLFIQPGLSVYYQT